jgi:pyridoxamine 5'-phosphate oxidase
MKEQKFGINPVLKTVRKDYDRSVLLEKECLADPFAQFELWLTEAMEGDSAYANAMTLSTVNASGMPDSRIVLLRNISYGGFTFFTNYKSTKGNQINVNPKACLLFFWKELERQVKIQGEIRFLPEGESDQYFSSRPFESQVGAWASQQSQVIHDRKSLDERYDKALQQYKNKTIPRPAHWGGYVLLPSAFEFWQGRKSRLHDRICYTWQPDQSWKLERLMP